MGIFDPDLFKPCIPPCSLYSQKAEVLSVLTVKKSVGCKAFSYLLTSDSLTLSRLLNTNDLNLQLVLILLFQGCYQSLAGRSDSVLIHPLT